MRIIYLHQYFNTLSMQGGTRSYEMARRLVKMGHSVSMITSWREQDGRKDWFVTHEDGIEVHWLPVPYSNQMSYKDRIKAFFLFAYHSSKRATSIGGDVVFATSTPLTIAIPGVSASRKLKIPLVFEVRDLWPELPIAIGAIKNPFIKKISRLLETWAYRNSEAIIALSPGMKEGIVKTGYDSKRVAVIPNSSDNADFTCSSAIREEWRKRRSWLGERPLLTYPGTFGKINGVGYMVGLAKALLEIAPEVRILLIGDGKEKKEVIERATAAGVLNVNLFIEDPVAKREMPAVFSGSDIICSLFIDMEEMQANSANKFFDTLAAGKTILINYGGWQADIINKHNCGVVTWRKSFEEAAATISNQLKNTIWIENSKSAARNLGVNFFDRDILSRQLEEVLLAAFNHQGEAVQAIAKGEYHKLP